MKCLNQNCDADLIEEQDHFCYKCGNYTAKGYEYLQNKENVDKILNGSAVKQDNRFTIITNIASLSFIILFILILLKNDDMYRPFYYLRRIVENYTYGYNTAIIKTDNMYSNMDINDLDDAKNIITKDLDVQTFKCSYSMDTLRLAIDLETDHKITNVSLCDVPKEEAIKIKEVIDKIYYLFPNIEGTLTNISITNPTSKDDYVAYFQSMYQFVNNNENINNYNKVNKTQILLNSYYFLNNTDAKLDQNWYVKDVTKESLIAHELGHYIVFKAFLKQKNMEDIILVTKDNETKINNLIKEYDSGLFADNILNLSLVSYNFNNKANLTIDEFASSISNYAAYKNNDKLIANETIAEAIHDYYLHGDNSAKASLEIVNTIKNLL